MLPQSIYPERLLFNDLQFALKFENTHIYYLVLYVDLGNQVYFSV